jgi:hypothetical protein
MEDTTLRITPYDKTNHNTYALFAFTLLDLRDKRVITINPKVERTIEYLSNLDNMDDYDYYETFLTVTTYSWVFEIAGVKYHVTQHHKSGDIFDTIMGKNLPEDFLD